MKNLSMKCHGIALIQVLLLSAILAVFLLAVAAKTKQHIQLAQSVKERTGAFLQLQNLETETIYALLTEPKSKLIAGTETLGKKWNFYGQPIPSASGTSVLRIIDISALVPLNNRGLVRHLVLQTGVAADLADKVAEEINGMYLPFSEVSSYQHQFISGVAFPKQRHAALQQIEDLRFLPAMTQDIYTQIRPYLTYFPIAGAYPLGMHANVLSYYVKQPELSEVLRLRELGELTPLEFERLTGITQGENIYYSPGNELRLCFTAIFNDGKLSRRMDVSLFPYAQQPFTVWDYQKIYHDKKVSNDCVY